MNIMSQKRFESVSVEYLAAEVTYLQCLHFTPKIMFFWHTWHVWESQDFVENL